MLKQSLDKNFEHIKLGFDSMLLETKYRKKSELILLLIWTCFPVSKSQFFQFNTTEVLTLFGYFFNRLIQICRNFET